MQLKKQLWVLFIIGLFSLQAFGGSYPTDSKVKNDVRNSIKSEAQSISFLGDWRLDYEYKQEKYDKLPPTMAKKAVQVVTKKNASGMSKTLKGLAIYKRVGEGPWGFSRFFITDTVVDGVKSFTTERMKEIVLQGMRDRPMLWFLPPTSTLRVNEVRVPEDHKFTFKGNNQAQFEVIVTTEKVDGINWKKLQERVLVKVRNFNGVWKYNIGSSVRGSQKTLSQKKVTFDWIKTQPNMGNTVFDKLYGTGESSSGEQSSAKPSLSLKVLAQSLQNALDQGQGLSLIGDYAKKVTSIRLSEYDFDASSAKWDGNNVQVSCLAKYGFKSIIEKRYPDYIFGKAQNTWLVTFKNEGNSFKPIKVSIPTQAKIVSSNTTHKAAWEKARTLSQ